MPKSTVSFVALEVIETVLRFITLLWLILMLILSHIGGTVSGEESRWLSRMTGIKESVLRRSAHIVVYIILATLTMLAWPDTELWIICLVLVVIAVVDETSKALPIFTGRHCSIFPDMVLNLVGCAIGVVIGVLIC